MGNGAAITNKVAGATITVLDNSSILGIPLNTPNDPTRTSRGTIALDAGKLIKVEDSGVSNIQAIILKVGQVQFDGGAGDIKLYDENGKFNGSYAPTPLPTPKQQKSFRSGSNTYGLASSVNMGGTLSGWEKITADSYTNAGTIRPGDDGEIGIVDTGVIMIDGNFT